MRSLFTFLFMSTAMMPNLLFAVETKDYSHHFDVSYKITGTPNIPLEHLERIRKIVSACYGSRLLQSIEVIPTTVREMVVPWFYEFTRFKSYMVRGTTYVPGQGSEITEFLGRAATTTWFQRDKLKDDFKLLRVDVNFNPYFYDGCTFQISPEL